MKNRYGIVGAAAVPHAPQLLSLPKTEDAAQVARVREAMKKIGDGFRALQPDLVIVIGNDHGDDFILRSVPAFMFHCGPRAAGRDGHKGWWKVDGEAGYGLLELMQQEGFDPAFTLDAPLGTFFTIPVEFMGYSRETAVLPLFINSYVPPQPPSSRCYAFGAALARAVERAGRRAVLIASGGLSHYPGTPAYADPGPDLETDRKIFERLSEGNLRHLLSMDEKALDASGNIELRSWLVLAGAIGERKPDVAQFEPNWHHTYGTFGWTALAPEPTPKLHYMATPTQRVELSLALHALRTDAKAAADFIADPQGFASRYELAAEEQAALVVFDEAKMRDQFGIHPLLTAGAARRLSLLKKAAS